MWIIKEVYLLINGTPASSIASSHCDIWSQQALLLLCGQVLRTLYTKVVIRWGNETLVRELSYVGRDLAAGAFVC
jgi:hypothetical protein